MQVRIITTYRNGQGGKWLIWSLAVLMLVFSCPVKRVLNFNELRVTTASSKSNRPVSNSIKAGGVTCCVFKADDEYTVQQSTVAVPQPGFTNSLFSSAGFQIFYKLPNAGGAEVSNPGPFSLSLPLFLQHASMLI